MKFAQDIADMAFDRANAYDQLISDYLVGKASGIKQVRTRKIASRNLVDNKTTSAIYNGGTANRYYG
jgi:hypothetical protein